MNLLICIISHCIVVISKSSHPTSNQVFKDYFGEIEEESIRDNFVVVYELLDETMDFGYPQTCESRILREYVNIFLSATYPNHFVLSDDMQVTIRSTLYTFNTNMPVLSINITTVIITIPSYRVVTQESNRLEVAPRPPVALTNAVSWRTEGIKHRKNEVRHTLL